MTAFNIALLYTPLMVSNGRRRRPTGSHQYSNVGVLLVLLLLLLQQVSGSRSPDSCNYNSRSQEDSELLVSFHKILKQLQPLENLFDIVCAGDNDAWATVQEDLVAVSDLARSLQERIPHKAKKDDKQSGRQSIIQGSPIQVGSSSNVKPKPVNVGNLTPFGAAIGIGANKPTNKVSALSCASLTPKINVQYVSIARSSGLLLNVRAGIDGCKEVVQKQIETDINCECDVSTTRPTIQTSTTVRINGTSLSTEVTPVTISTITATTPVTVTTASEGTTISVMSTTSTEKTIINGTTTEGTTGTGIIFTPIYPPLLNGSTITTAEGSTATGTPISPITPGLFNGTTTTEITPVSSITTTTTTTTTTTEGTTGTGITTAPTKETEINGTTTSESKPANLTATTATGTTVSGITPAPTKETEVSGTTTEGTTGTGITTSQTKETDINGTTTTSESKPSTASTTTTTEGTTVSGTTFNGTTSITISTTEATTSTGYTINGTCVTASANITAEITKLNEHMKEIQDKIAGVTQALIECSMDKNALEKAKVLTQTLRELIQRLQGVLDRLSTLQGQPQARLIPAFLRNFNVPSLRDAYSAEEEVDCAAARSSFPESFTAIDLALVSLAEHPTNSSVADQLYCSASHMVDTASQVMQGPQVRQGALFEETNLASTTNDNIDHVLKVVAKEEIELETRRSSLENELKELNARTKDIEGQLIEAKKELQQEDNEN